MDEGNWQWAYHMYILLWMEVFINLHYFCSYTVGFKDKQHFGEVFSIIKPKPKECSHKSLYN